MLLRPRTVLFQKKRTEDQRDWSSAFATVLPQILYLIDEVTPMTASMDLCVHSQSNSLRTPERMLLLSHRRLQDSARL